MGSGGRGIKEIIEKRRVIRLLGVVWIVERKV